MYEAAIKNLRECQRQLDADGIEVGVSRQALEEVLSKLGRDRHDANDLIEDTAKAIWEENNGPFNPLNATGKIAIRQEAASAVRFVIARCVTEIEAVSRDWRDVGDGQKVSACDYLILRLRSLACFAARKDPANG